jgi:hypothetical protein
LTDIFAEVANPKELLDAGLGEHCVYTISAYPTQQMENNYNTQEPLWYALVILGAFLSTALFFLIFNGLVQRRQAKVMTTALKAHAILSSLFPKNIQAKMMAEVDKKHKLSNVGKAGIKTFLIGVEKENDTKVDKSKPIADLFPETTIMFADIAGQVQKEPPPKRQKSDTYFLPFISPFVTSDSQHGAPRENLVRSLHFWKRFIMSLMP